MGHKNCKKQRGPGAGAPGRWAGGAGGRDAGGAGLAFSGGVGAAGAGGVRAADTDRQEMNEFGTEKKAAPRASDLV